MNAPDTDPPDYTGPYTAEGKAVYAAALERHRREQEQAAATRPSRREPVGLPPVPAPFPPVGPPPVVKLASGLSEVARTAYRRVLAMKRNRKSGTAPA